MAKMTRTSLFLDPEVVREAQRALGTKTTAETVRVALDEVLKRERRKEVRMLELDMTLEDLREMRRTPWDDPA